MSIADQLEKSLRCFTVAELAETLNVHPLTLRRHIKAGRLQAFYVGTAVRIQPAAAAEWLRDRSGTVQ